ncbi:MAG: hypothetical protein E7Z97_04750 [Propionibacteriaceae bacterium]|jgi:hypothetical protein|nr:hypothetical protein [Propionibacteriaceae bacterium]
MTARAVRVEQALLALEPRERAAVIHRGLLSLDDEDEGAETKDRDAAWREEITRRTDEILQDRIELGSFEQTHARFCARHPQA